jgi:conjugative relaxase-like TrwC/TraI family protein
MITHSKATSSSGPDGVAAYLTATEYYLAQEGQEGGTIWWGGGAAEALGLRQGMTPDEFSEAMKALLSGYHPTARDANGERVALVQNAGDVGRLAPKRAPDGTVLLRDDGRPVLGIEGGRVMAHDFTYSPPKAFSLLYAMSDEATQKQLRAAMAEANEKGMAYLAERAQTRTGSASQGTRRYEHAEVVRASVVHFASREQDPSLHIHNAVMNVTLGADGQWRSLETRAMLAARKDADRITSAHLAGLVEAMGYKTEAVQVIDRKGHETGETTWTLAGMPKEMEQAWSKRHEAIRAYQDAHPGATDAEAWAVTRKGKDEPSLGVMTDTWRRELAAWGEAHGAKATAAAYHAEPQPAQAVDWRAWDAAAFVDRVHDIAHAATVPVSAIEAAVAMTAGAIDFDDARRIAAEIAAEHFQAIGARAEAGAEHEKTETRFVAHRWLAMERRIVEIAQASTTDRRHAVPEAEVAQQIADFQTSKGFALSDEQAAAIRHLTQETGSVAVLEGLAGTGKTTSIVVAVKSWEAQGLDVIGVSTSEAATRKLAEESGIERAWNGAKLLDMIGRGSLELTPRAVLVLDEAGMMDTRQAHGLMTAAQAAGSKVVLLGDVRQLQSVGGGSPMAAVRAEIGSAKLEGIRRQQGADLIVSKLLYGYDGAGRLRTDQEERTAAEIHAQSAAVFGEMERQGLVRVVAERDQAVRALADGYTSSAVPLDRRIVLAHTHADREALNAAIRPILREQGVLTGDDHIVGVAAERTLSLAEGDRITFDENHRYRAERDEQGRSTAPTWAAEGPDGKPLNKIDVTNGMRATVEAIRPETITVDGKEQATHRVTVVLHSDDERDGARLSWRVDTMPQIGHGYATTVHRAQGQTMEDVYHLANAAASNEGVLVGFTRVKTNERGGYHLAGDADAVDALRTYAIGRLNAQRNALDLMREAQEAAAAAAITKEAGPQGVALVGHGAAPYEHKPNAKPSYYLTVRGRDGKERTVWGVGLREAIQESGARPGDRITFAVSGGRSVEVDDDDGKRITATRNTWRVARIADLRREAEQITRAGAEVPASLRDMLAASGIAAPTPKAAAKEQGRGQERGQTDDWAWAMEDQAPVIVGGAGMLAADEAHARAHGGTTGAAGRKALEALDPGARRPGGVGGVGAGAGAKSKGMGKEAGKTAGREHAPAVSREQGGGLSL